MNKNTVIRSEHFKLISEREFGKNMKNYEKLLKLIKIDVYSNLFHGIYDSTGHGLHNIMIYNIVSHNSLFLLCFLDIAHFVGIYE